MVFTVLHPLGLITSGVYYFFYSRLKRQAGLVVIPDSESVPGSGRPGLYTDSEVPRQTPEEALGGDPRDVERSNDILIGS